MPREFSLALCCLAAITFGAGCSETTDMETAAQPQGSGPRAPNPTPGPWITAVEPHQGFNDDPALVVTPSGEVFVGCMSYRNGVDALAIDGYLHRGDRFIKQLELQPSIQRLCHRNVVHPQSIIDLTVQLS